MMKANREADTSCLTYYVHVPQNMVKNQKTWPHHVAGLSCK